MSKSGTAALALTPALLLLPIRRQGLGCGVHFRLMQKALTQMNVQFQHVISDLTGLTGLAILDAIMAGERDPAVLAKLRDPHIKATEETIRKSLTARPWPRA